VHLSREWKREREERFVFNPSSYAPTSNQTRELLRANAPCSLQLHAHWTERAPATLGLGLARR
jgi:hypothetical protein